MGKELNRLSFFISINLVLFLDIELTLGNFKIAPTTKNLKAISLRHIAYQCI